MDTIIGNDFGAITDRAQDHYWAGGINLLPGTHVALDDLGTEIVERVKALYLTGETSERIRQAVINTPGYNRLTLPIYVIDDFREAVLAAASSALEGDVVILSPACSSFDKFKNFVERGNTFRKIVLEL